MSEQSNDDFASLIKLAMLGGAVWMIYQLVNSIVAAVTTFLFGLATICLIAAGVLVGFTVLRYLAENQYGQDIRMRRIQKLERQRQETLAGLPKHLRQQADDYFRKKQEKLYDTNPHSILDTILEWVRKWRKGGQE